MLHDFPFMLSPVEAFLEFFSRIKLSHLCVVVQFESGGRFQPEKDFSLRSK